MNKDDGCYLCAKNGKHFPYSDLEVLREHLIEKHLKKELADQIISQIIFYKTGKHQKARVVEILK